MADRAKNWCKHHAGLLANLFAVLAVVLLGVVCVQAWMLHSRGWRIALGTVPEWASAAFTGIAAIGVLAAFGNLRIVRREWESEQAERRDQLANQARRIIVEAVPVAEMVPPANQAPPRPDLQPEYRYVVIRNHSEEPVFNVRIPHESPKRTPPSPVTNVMEVMSAVDARGSVRRADGSPIEGVFRLGSPRLVPVLAPGQATPQLDLPTVPRDEQPTEYVFFTFTDARGAEWQRLGSEQPVPIKRDPQQ
jgi:hypothetical protein